jgi:hypothetical protein
MEDGREVEGKVEFEETGRRGGGLLPAYARGGYGIWEREERT